MKIEFCLSWGYLCAGGGVEGDGMRGGRGKVVRYCTFHYRPRTDTNWPGLLYRFFGELLASNEYEINLNKW